MRSKLSLMDPYNRDSYAKFMLRARTNKSLPHNADYFFFFPSLRTAALEIPTLENKVTLSTCPASIPNNI